MKEEKKSRISAAKSIGKLPEESPPLFYDLKTN